MEQWIKCKSECGNCELNIKDNRFLSVLPADIIEWAHNLLDYIILYRHDIQGFPLDYFISCNNSARINTCIVSADISENVSLSNNIFQHVIRDISHCMIIYSRAKMYLNSTYGYKLPYFILSDISEFRRFGNTSNSTHMVDVLLDGIRTKYE